MSDAGVVTSAVAGSDAGLGEEARILPLRYEVERRLGAGRTGVVYRVRDLARGGARLVLKKLKLAPGAGQDVERLKREFLALSQIHHPNIVGAYDFGLLPGTGEAWFTQDWVDGGNILEAASRAEVGKVCVWASQASLALHFLHGQGIVHGDVKPQHVLVDESPKRAEESVRLIDLGFGRLPDDKTDLLTGGTEPYMAPEVAESRAADHRADIYSLGVLLFQILALKYVGGAEDFVPAKLGRRLDKMVAAGMPETLRTLLKRMTARSPSERCQDVREAHEALARLAGEPPAAPVAFRLCVSPAGSPGLVDRVPLLKSFQEALGRLGDPKLRGHGLILSGEAGSGKSRVTEEFRTRAQLAGIGCVKTGFKAGGRPVYEPFLDAIRVLRLDNGLPSEVQAERQNEVSDAMANAKWPGHCPGGGGAGVYWKWQTLGASQKAACAGRPAVLIFEDLHLADTDELCLWGYLVRSLSDLPILFCATYREGEAGAKAVASLAEDLTGQGLATHLPVGHLTDGDARLFVERYLGLREIDPAAAQALYKRSGGNPLYLRQILAGVLERPTSGDSDEFDLPSLIRDATAPASLRSVIRGRFSLLDKPERDCLAAMAVLNRPASLEELAKVANPETQAAGDGVAGLVAKGIVRPSAASPQRFEFEHSEHTDVAYEDAGPETRREMHRRAAETLEAELRAGNAGLTEEVAGHYLKAGIDDKAAAYCLAAARQAKDAYAHERASRYYVEALKRLEAGSETYFEAAEDYVICCEWLNRHETVVEWCQRLLQHPISGRYRGSILTRLGAALRVLRDLHGASAAFAEADRVLKSAPQTVEFFRLRLRLLDQRSREGHYEEALRGLLRLDRKRVAMGPYLRGYLYESIGRTYQYLPQLQLARNWYERSLAEYERAEHPLKMGYLRLCLGHVAYGQNRYADALSLYEAAYAQLQPFGLSEEIGLTLHSLGSIAHVLGDMDRAARQYRDALRVYRKYATVLQCVDLLSALGLTQMLLAQFEAARGSIEEAMRLQGSASDLPTFDLQIRLATIAAAAGDAERADQAIGHLNRLRGNAFFNKVCELRLCHVRGRRELAFGSKERATGLLRQHLALATELNRRSDICEASLLLAQSLGDEAEESFQLCQNALDVARQTNHGVWQPEALFALGRIHFRRGDAHWPFELLLECVERCRRTGMKDLCWRALALLAGAHERAGNARYAANYDRECLDVLQEIKSQFGSEDQWEAFLAVPDRQALYGQVAARVRARAIPAQGKRAYASVS